MGFLNWAIAIIDECLNQTNAIANLKKRALLRGELYFHKALFLYELKPAKSTESILANSLKAMGEYEKALHICIDPGYTNVGYYYNELGE